MEAHGGYSFCGLAALMLMGKGHLCDSESLLRWAANRQMRLEGGFQVKHHFLQHQQPWLFFLKARPQAPRASISLKSCCCSCSAFFSDLRNFTYFMIFLDFQVS